MEEIGVDMKILFRSMLASVLVFTLPLSGAEAATSPKKALSAFRGYLSDAERTYTSGMAKAKSEYDAALSIKQSNITQAKKDFRQYNQVRVLKLGDNRNYWGNFNCPTTRPDCIYVDKGPKFEVGEVTTIKDVIADGVPWLDEIDLIIGLGLIELQSPTEYRRAATIIKSETLAIDTLNRNYTSTKMSLQRAYEEALVVEPAILAIKRASKSPKDFDRAFVTALKFEYNLQGLDELANLPFRYINSLKALDSAVKVTKLSQDADEVAARYTMAGATKINKICGKTFISDTKFVNMFNQIADLYVKLLGKRISV
jgi:hypothetical protein